MSGIQLYLRQPTPLSRGHVVYSDSPWAVSGISQSQFWPVDFAATYGDGTAHECVSMIASDWTAPGRLTGKAARDCTPEEVVGEIWEEMKRHVNDQQRAELTDDLLLGWHLDPGMIERAGGGFYFEDPLVLPTVGAWPLRPETTTAIPNLVLAGDYVRGDWEMANMEIANESGRRAANAILERSGSSETPVPVFGTYRPPESRASSASTSVAGGSASPTSSTHTTEPAPLPTSSERRRFPSDAPPAVQSGSRGDRSRAVPMPIPTRMRNGVGGGHTPEVHAPLRQHAP